MRVIDYFDNAAERYAARTAIIDRSHPLTYAELQGVTKQVALGLLGDRFTPGDRVAVYGRNSGAALACMLGLMRAGGVWIPVNPRNPVEVNADFLRHVGASWLFHDREFRPEVARLHAVVPTLQRTICVDADPDEPDSLARLLGPAGAEPPWPHAEPCCGEQDLVGIVPTGGTTGVPKAVRSGSISFTTRLEVYRQRFAYGDSSPVCLTVSPLTHSSALALAMLTLGAAHVLLPEFKPETVLETIARERVTHLIMPPTGLHALLEHPGVREFDYSSLRYFILGSAPVTPDQLRRAVEVFGPSICQSYGQTEVPLMTWLAPEVLADAVAGRHPQRLRSCGQPADAVRMAIMDERSCLLPAGQIGEVVVRSKLVNPGYHANPEATAGSRRDGWHCTGDLGYLDADGFLYLVDRKKDVVITGGFNVYSAEVEATLMDLNGVKECVVVGVPHEKWGEAVTAAIVARSGEPLTADRVIAHCKARLGGVKAPKAVHFFAELPKTAVGKYDKKHVREMCSSRHAGASMA